MELTKRHRKILTTDSFDAANVSAPIGASQKVIDLKEKRHQLNGAFLPLNWNTYPTAMADSSGLWKGANLLTRWAFEYLDQTAMER